MHACGDIVTLVSFTCTRRVLVLSVICAVLEMQKVMTLA